MSKLLMFFGVVLMIFSMGRLFILAEELDPGEVIVFTYACGILCFYAGAFGLIMDDR